MENKIIKINKKLAQFQVEETTKDKVIIGLKNQDTKLNAKIIKMKEKHIQDLLKVKIDSNAIRLKIKK